MPGCVADQEGHPVRVAITGSSGHLGEALGRVLSQRGDEVVGIDVVGGPATTVPGSILDRDVLDEAFHDVDVVFHPAALHKPHVATHPKSDFVDVNVTGTLHVLEAAVAAGVSAVVATSTTSAFGLALSPADDGAATWIDESVVGLPKNVYGATKVAAEQLCALFHHEHGLPVVVLRTSRFFPEADDDPARRASMSDDNLKAIEFLSRRVALADVVSAHLAAAEAAPGIGHDRYVVSAPTPFRPEDVDRLGHDLPAVLADRAPVVVDLCDRLGWRLPTRVDRVYDSRRAVAELGWEPAWDAERVCRRALAGHGVLDPLAVAVGAKGYHPGGLVDGMYRLP